MREESIIGNNLQILLNNNKINNSKIASSLGYTEDDMTRICEGRVYLSMGEIKAIADFFNVDVEDLIASKSSEEYEKAGCIHFNHPFKYEKNLEEIMDLFDLICDIEEVI